MITFLITFGIFLLVIVGMALGYILQKKTISGSCGGLSSVGIKKVCDCPDPCENKKKQVALEAAEKIEINDKR